MAFDRLKATLFRNLPRFLIGAAAILTVQTTAFQINTRYHQSPTTTKANVRRRALHELAPARYHFYRVTSDSRSRSRLNASISSAEEQVLVQPDYLITDSKGINAEERPSFLSFLQTPRNLLGLSVVSVGFILTLYNVVGVYNDSYVSWEVLCIGLGLLNAIADFVSVLNIDSKSNPTEAVSPNPRLGMADDALIHAYAAFYTTASAWLSFRACKVVSAWLYQWDPLIGGLSTLIFAFSLVMPTITLMHYHGSVDMNDKLQSIVALVRRKTHTMGMETGEHQNDNTRLSLTETELLRVRSLLIIGAIGCVFAPVALSFALGGQEWWFRVTNLHPSQVYLESTTELYGLLATQASMISHRAAKAGVAPLEKIVPLFTLVCFLLAVLPCICSLYWLGDDISFFSFYRE